MGEDVYGLADDELDGEAVSKEITQTEVNRMIAMALCREALKKLAASMRKAAADKTADEFEKEFSDWEREGKKKWP